MKRRLTSYSSLYSVLCLVSFFCIPHSSLAEQPVPDCRYDNSLIPIVDQAVKWTIADFKAKGIHLPVKHIVYNQPSVNDKHTLTIHIVKDATVSTVDQSGCIVKKSFSVNGSTIFTDGDCIPTDRSKCTSYEKAYMARRFIEIHRRLVSTVEMSYESTGACYMTNLQACLHRDRLALLKILGARDRLSVKGSCVTNVTPPMTIHCSAGALKMMLSKEAAAELAPTVGILFILSHEFGHLSENISSSYDVSDYTIQRDWPREDKLAVIRNQCRLGDSLRSIETRADEKALMVARRHLSEIHRRWPKQGTMAWLVTQAGHYSGNLVRWNNDWRDGEFADEPKVFMVKSNITILNDKDLEYMDKENVPSGYTPIEVRLRSKEFLCELTEKKPGRWMVLIQSGTTHGTMVERIAWLLGNLRRSMSKSDIENSGTEGLTGKIMDLTLRRHRAYLRELEADICDQIEQRIICPGDLPQ